MENNDYISVSSSIWQVGLRHTWLTQLRSLLTTKKIISSVISVSFYTIMFSFNPLHSQQSQDDLILSSDIPLSREELVQIKNKIEQERIVAPTWIYIDDKMYLIEKRVTILENSIDKESERKNKRSYKSQAKHQT